MKRVLSLAFLGAFALAMAAELTSISNILKDVEKFDKKSVKTSGKVAKFKQKTSKAGNDYMSFELTEGSSKLNVYARGKMELKDGDKVEVEGRFVKEKVMFKDKPNEFTIKNEVDCSGKKDEGPKIKVLK
jgi:DNA polymerase III alpha subunit